ncbi:MAG: sugar transferase, partial [bacterium]
VLALESEWQMGFSIQGYLTPEQVHEGGISDLSKGGNNRPKSRNLGDLVFVIALDDNEPTELSNLILKLTLASAQSIHIIPPLRGIPLYGAELSYFFSHEVLMLGIKNNLAIRLSKTIKRVFDFTLTVLLLLPSSLIFLMAGLFIWFEDRGPIFFIQRRLGVDGKPFNMIKLRSMRQDADQMLDDWRSRNTLEWAAYRANGNKLENDPRQLKIGRLLRRSSIDELPQLFNVLRGEMSLVGPRPILERESADYGANLILYKTTRPGMTGLWQVSGRSKASFHQRSSLDGWYIRNWSLTYDIIIILRTIGVVLSGRGAF